MRIIGLIFLIGVSDFVMAQGTGQNGEYFRITRRTTIDDAAGYLERVLPTLHFESRDQSLSDKITGFKTHHIQSCFNYSACCVEIKQERTVIEEQGEQSLKKIWEFWSEIRFRDVIKAEDTGSSIKLTGLTYRVATSYIHYPDRRFPTMVGKFGRPENIQSLSILYSDSSYDVLKAVNFLIKECGGGGVFHR